MEKRLQPKSFIGIIGHDADTFYLTQAAQRMGYYVAIYNPVSDNSAGHQADIHTVGSYSDRQKLLTFASNVDTLLYTTKDLSNDIAHSLGDETYLPQGDNILSLAQDRVLHRVFLQSIGVTTLPYATVVTKEDVFEAAERIGFPCVLKRNLINDINPKQQVFHNTSDIEAFNDSTMQGSYILEEYIEEQTRVTIVLAVDEEDNVHPVTLSQTTYHQGKMHSTFNPPQIKDEPALEIFRLGKQIAQSMTFVGVIAIEFLMDEEENIFVDDIHPFPDETARYTLNAANITQYDAFVRVITGIPLGQIYHYRPAVALIVYEENKEKAWDIFEKYPAGVLHYYTNPQHKISDELGKDDAKAHVTYVAEDIDELTDILNAWYP